MPVFDSTTLTRFFNQAEVHLSQEYPFLVDRLSLALNDGQGMYQLPDYVSSIRRVTYLGWKLDPMPARNLREVFQSATQKGRPFWYVFNNTGLRTIKLFPAPSPGLAQITDLWNEADTNQYQQGFIVEFARISDNTAFTVPSYFRRQLLKQWTAKQCFGIEGPGQNLKISNYFDKQWQGRKARFFSYLDDVHNISRKMIVSEIVSGNYFPASPVLPIARFGQPVDEGY